MRSVLLVGLVAGSALAATVMDRTFAEMSAQVPLIVRATIGASEARWVGKRIETFTQAQVTEIIKGHPAKRIVLRQPGGEVGNLGQRVDGAARFSAGEDVVLFLEPARDDPSVYLVSGLAAGKVKLLHEPGGKIHARRELGGLAFYRRGAVVTDGPLKTLDREDLGEASSFLARIRHAASGGAK